MYRIESTNARLHARQSLLEVVAEEAEVMSHFTDCCGYLIKAERAAFVPTV